MALTGGLDTQHAVELLRIGGLARLRTRLGDALPDASLAALRLRACLELSKRLMQARLPAGDLMNRVSVVAKYLLARYSQPGQAVAGALFLDRRHQLIEERELFRGNEVGCPVSPEPVLRIAVGLGARGVLAWHTHTTGEVAPSPEDGAWAGRLEQACDVLGVMLVDYLILGGTEGWCSMRLEGLVGRADPPQACPNRQAVPVASDTLERLGNTEAARRWRQRGG
ncbi:MAG: hypothetical protein KDD47_06040 [Acidobacteria bacterium]|nr:hypothetical protein [Acidobacteriota bacterium]